MDKVLHYSQFSSTNYFYLWSCVIGHHPIYFTSLKVLRTLYILRMKHKPVSDNDDALVY